MKYKKYIIIAAVLVCPIVYVWSCHNSGKRNIDNGISFNKKLSFYQLFKGEMSALEPADGVAVFQLSSTLFTDYAEKQRLIKLPKGKQMVLSGDGLPVFPEGTIIAKTFYYSKVKDKGRRLIETRLLILHQSKWNAATFRWNAAQNDADLITDGANIPIDFTSLDGEKRKIAYHIPTKQECGSCHRQNDAIIPIGPKARNLNIKVERTGENINQLIYLMKKGMIKETKINSLIHLADYQDISLPLEQRARAYMDINCAHCHQQGGFAGNTTLNLDYRTGLEHTGIKFNKSNIIIRTSKMGEFHMPKLGTTVIDDDGIALMKKYISEIK
ncbi:c-type cytochrome [Pedobacter jeongneungensis]|uniref:c-type cytochrome n=1 Tax=Pedobacter jeongneungensis TaxID=947309 RepID=UPI0004684440|nr:c-type cytochrome [Pedobacter jeongneungensis]